MTKSFWILKNVLQVRDNLTVMCLKHDLVCVDCSKSFGYNAIICTLRSFDDITKMIEHIKTKANKSKYSFKLKGKFALVTIGEKKYIYRITLKKEES
jgi:3-deoxy-D-manno-octulosonic acid (KDO) 8-phosphate synthase